MTTGSFTGFKRMYPAVRLTKGVISDAVIVSHSQGVVHTGDDDSVCVWRHFPTDTIDACDCGFYALRQRDLIENLLFSGALMIPEGTSDIYKTSGIATVALSGEVVEGERGIRGSRQTVLDMQLPGTCWQCPQPASQLVTGEALPAGDLRKASSLWPPHKHNGVFFLHPSCSRCAGASGVSVTASEYETLSGYPVRFDGNVSQVPLRWGAAADITPSFLDVGTPNRIVRSIWTVLVGVFAFLLLAAALLSTGSLLLWSVPAVSAAMWVLVTVWPDTIRVWLLAMLSVWMVGLMAAEPSAVALTVGVLGSSVGLWSVQMSLWTVWRKDLWQWWGHIALFGATMVATYVSLMVA